MNEHLQNILNFLQQAEHLSDEEKNTFIKEAKAADKEFGITAFKLERTEKVKHTTAVLLEETIEELEQKRKAVEIQNRELEIEAALERVRAIAMSMSKPEDMLDVCTIISHQLESLNVQEIRNVQTAIFYEEKGTYMNYEYYARHNKTFITETTYTNNEIHAAFAEKMLKGNGETFISHINGEEVRNWIAYQKTTNVFIDDHLYTAASLNYYWFSLGPVALGISTYEPLQEEEINLFRRFLKVFELAYRRFLDIEKAIAQAREAQVQLALERVRARTMAMQRSDELSETAFILYQQFKQLGEIPIQITIGIFNEEAHTIEFRITGGDSIGSRVDQAFNFNIDEPTLLQKFHAAWKQQKKSIVIELTGQELVDWIRYRSAASGITNTGAEISSDEHRFICAGFFSKGLITFSKEEPIAEETVQILERFAGVFDLTYTRFLDLQKAEAQAREAQVQLALERVRSRTMAMQKSDELAESAALLFQQVESLGIASWVCGFSIWDEERKGATIWGADKGKIRPSFKTANEHIFLDLYEAAQRGESLCVEQKTGEALEAHYRYMKTLPMRGDILKGLSVSGALPATQIIHAAYFLQGYLIFITYEPVPEAHDIFKRFAKVFEQTYTRFLDLQKAEAQTREAQIEAALERVRSRSLAVHKSDEFKEVIKVVFEKLHELGIIVSSVSINTVIEGSKDYEAYVCGQNTAELSILHFRLSYFDHPILNDRFKARQSGLDFFSKSYGIEEKNNFYEHLFEVSDLKYVPDDIRKMVFQSNPYTASYALAKHSTIVVNDFEGKVLSENEIDIVKRFSKVFEQAYIRFLDLQKAEAQAKEAQIEAALERVRARAMAMHKSEELKEVANELRKQLGLLGQNELETCAIHLYDESPDYFQSWAALLSPNEQGEVVQIQSQFPKRGVKIIEEMLECYARHKQDYILINEGAKAQEFLEMIKQKAPEVFEVVEKSMKEQAPENKRAYWSVADFAGGSLVMTTMIEPDENSRALLRRFANVFGLAYRRFADLKQAEARAKEAQIEAALEKVRSRTLAMQRSDELAETAAVLFKQLILLGIEPNRLYINIIKDENGDAEFWITGEDGNKVGSGFRANMNNNRSLKKMYTGWKEKKRSLVIDMKGKELQEYFQHLSSLHVSFKDSLSQKRRVQYLAYFNKGFIGMASPEEQPRETVFLLERFAAVFNLTFTRFNDLKIAEAHALQAEQDLIEIKAAKKKAENALVELRATQKQLIQSEKMASLGELTAGIAHEIQNPLNFVNNFSEVNNELIEELKSERSKVKGERDEKLEDQLLNDILENEQKINHHGKRADAIVKSMLQHTSISSGRKEPTDINALCDEYLRLSYHGMRAKDKSFNATLQTDFDPSIKKINIVPQDIGRVLLNLYNNAFYAVMERRKAESESYKAEVTVTTKIPAPSPSENLSRHFGRAGGEVEIRVADNGIGIPQNIVDKIFQPFFTTKPTGQGTGLGLSLSYDIVKAHGGDIRVETKEGEGSEFIIELPG